jgi:hypothetical protein
MLSEVKTSVRELEDEMSLLGRELPEVLKSKEEVAL